MKCKKCKTELFECDIVERYYQYTDTRILYEKYRCPKCFEVVTKNE